MPTAKQLVIVFLLRCGRLNDSRGGNTFFDHSLSQPQREEYYLSVEIQIFKKCCLDLGGDEGHPEERRFLMESTQRDASALGVMQKEFKDAEEVAISLGVFNDSEESHGSYFGDPYLSHSAASDPEVPPTSDPEIPYTSDAKVPFPTEDSSDIECGMMRSNRGRKSMKKLPKGSGLNPCLQLGTSQLGIPSKKDLTVTTLRQVPRTTMAICELPAATSSGCFFPPPIIQGIHSSTASQYPVAMAPYFPAGDALPLCRCATRRTLLPSLQPQVSPLSEGVTQAISETKAGQPSASYHTLLPSLHVNAFPSQLEALSFVEDALADAVSKVTEVACIVDPVHTLFKNVIREAIQLRVEYLLQDHNFLYTDLNQELPQEFDTACSPTLLFLVWTMPGAIAKLLDTNDAATINGLVALLVLLWAAHCMSTNEQQQSLYETYCQNIVLLGSTYNMCTRTPVFNVHSPSLCRQ
ncbi:hypothetical protein EV401DRAFT_2198684 [Pisolithus croceorrhizus]|nr:hypothetical protein EV401DRAFT_2198684 [Pisolithus croceorrhizus]